MDESSLLRLLLLLFLYSLPRSAQLMPRLLSEQQRILPLQNEERPKILVNFLFWSHLYSVQIGEILILFASSYSWGYLWVSLAKIMPRCFVLFLSVCFLKGWDGERIKLVKPVWSFLQAREMVRPWIQTQLTWSARGNRYSLYCLLFPPSLGTFFGFSTETAGDSHQQPHHSAAPS